MKRNNFKPNSLILPLPVLMIGTFDKDLNPNLMNAAWGGIYDTNQIHICLSSDHKTSSNIKISNCFSIGFVNKDNVDIADYVGCISGNNIDKIKSLNLKYETSSIINAPLFDICPITLECKINKIDDDGTTMHVVGDIVNISVDDNYIKDNNIDLDNFIPITYDSLNNCYRSNNIIVGKAFNHYK